MDDLRVEGWKYTPFKYLTKSLHKIMIVLRNDVFDWNRVYALKYLLV